MDVGTVTFPISRCLSQIKSNVPFIKKKEKMLLNPSFNNNNHL